MTSWTPWPWPALALAVTALLGHKQGLATLPETPETDALGLPMEMVYVRLSNSSGSR